MKKHIGFKRWTLLFLFIIIGGMAQEKESKITYPAPQEGWEKVVVDLPVTKKDLKEHRVEFTVGFEMETDLCNPYSLIGDWTEYEVKGTELIYFIASTKGQVVKTMGECPTDKKISQFVGLKSSSVVYNGEQPLVVYIPEGYQLRYRLWSADKKWNNYIAKKGASSIKKNKAPQ